MDIDDDYTYSSGVLVLDHIYAKWRPLTGSLGGARAYQAGVLVGDQLLCLGGREDVVCGAVVSVPIWR